MSIATVEERLTALEAKYGRLAQQVNPEAAQAEKPWWEQIRGQFKDDPLYDEAMWLGRERQKIGWMKHESYK